MMHRTTNRAKRAADIANHEVGFPWDLYLQCDFVTWLGKCQEWHAVYEAALAEFSWTV